MQNKLKKVIEAVGKKFQTKVTLSKLGNSQPLEEMNSILKVAIEDAANLLNYSYEYLPSGAGHAAAIAAAHSNSQGEPIPVAMILSRVVSAKAMRKKLSTLVRYKFVKARKCWLMR